MGKQALAEKLVAKCLELAGPYADEVYAAVERQDAATLKAYAAAAGFDWRFAVASPDVLREMSELYGAQYLNPPSAPMLLVTLTGDVLPLPAGVKSAQTLQDTITGYLGV